MRYKAIIKIVVEDMCDDCPMMNVRRKTQDHGQSHEFFCNMTDRMIEPQCADYPNSPVPEWCPLNNGQVTIVLSEDRT